MDTATADRIHVLWDELADFDAALADAALDRLLAALCDLIDAQNANWFGAVRLADHPDGDPMHGWRPRAVRYLHPSTPIDTRVKKLKQNLDRGDVDETAVRNVALAGAYRANRLADLASPEWFASDHYLVHYKGLGHVDVIWAGVPINADAECYFGFFRDGERPPFSVAERDAVAYALRGLKWFHRRQMLSRGLLVAKTPLTPVERRALKQLLGELPEKEIAAALGQSRHTTHEYVTAIYRKFGVNSRIGLMALWLGRAA